MNATDFIFDSRRLSDFGYIIAEIDESPSVDTVEAGVPITFTSVSRNKGKHFSLVNTVYDKTLEITFTICKDTCANAYFEIDDSEYLELTRWLCRSEFIELTFIDDEKIEPRHYKGAFNVSKVEYGGDLIGLELTFNTDRPYAYGDTISAQHTFTAGSQWIFTDDSNYVGTIAPVITITCSSSGTLQITNAFNSSTIQIKNCTQGEVITVDSENCLISTDSSSHDIYEDFNYEFMKLGNTYSSRENVITASGACTVKFEYSPIIIDTF